MVLLLAGSGAWGTSFWNGWVARGGQPVFYQTYFEPAVMIACGRGFVISKVQPKPLEDFLFLRTDRFDCADLPVPLETDPDHVYQAAWMYLETTVGWAWKILGISWSGMGPLFGLLFAISTGLAYGIFRLSTRPIVALLASTALALSSTQLLNLPHLRDYAKTPFTLALVLLLGILVTRPVRGRTLLVLATAYGVVLGIGYGFRTDFLASLPLLLIVVFGFLPGSLFERLPLKAAAAAVFLAAFTVVSWPITSAVYEKGGCQWHVALLGLQSPFDEHLRVEPAPYDFGHAYSDAYIDRTVNGYRSRSAPADAPLTFCSHEYDVQSGHYLRAIVAGFPADLLTRAYASVFQIVELPFRNFQPPMAGWFAPVYQARAWLLRPQHRWGFWFAALAILMTGAISLRLAAVLMLFLAYFGGYPAIQFQERHYFHLEFMGWWAMAFVLQGLVTAPFAIRSQWPDSAACVKGFLRAGMLLLIAAIAAGAILTTARWYQARQAREMFAAYLAAPTTAIEPPLGPVTGVGRAWPQLLEIDVNPAACGTSPVLTLQYDKSDISQDFTRTIALDHRVEGSTRIFMPVFEKYTGLSVPGAGPDCIRGVRRVTDVTPFPLLLGVTLPPRWAALPFYQRLTDWEFGRAFGRGGADSP